MDAVKVYALLAWFDENPAALTRCVESLGGFADHLIAVDGAYAAWPDPCGRSAPAQAVAIWDAAERVGVECEIYQPTFEEPWQGGEVEKRAFMFEEARRQGATPDDWLLVIDADMSVASFAADWRYRLEDYPYDTAEVRIHNMRPDGHVYDTYPRFRSLFRAIPGLTCKWAHYLYCAPLEVGWRFLWMTPAGHQAETNALDLSGHVTLHHHPLDRSAERDAAARTYYQNRDALNLETAPHY